jgi:hypothetical protein
VRNYAHCRESTSARLVAKRRRFSSAGRSAAAPQRLPFQYQALQRGHHDKQDDRPQRHAADNDGCQWLLLHLAANAVRYRCRKETDAGRRAVINIGHALRGGAEHRFHGVDAGCESAWGPDADRHAKALIIIWLEEPNFGAYSQCMTKHRGIAAVAADFLLNLIALT